MSYIYIIGSTDEEYPFYKIGISSRLKNRLKELQVGNVQELTVKYYVKSENAQAIEMQVHTKFKPYLVRGEWFLFSEQILNEAIIYLRGISK